MKKIHKYTLSIIDYQTIDVPPDYEVLTAQIQNGDIQLWILVDPTTPDYTRLKIGIFGTGNPIYEPVKKYISTVQLDDGKLVFHVFELV